MLKMIKNYGLHKRKDEINEILILFFQKIFHFQFNYHCYKWKDQTAYFFQSLLLLSF